MAYTDNFSSELIALVDDLVSAERMEFSELLFEQTFAQSDIATQHEVVTGVRSGHVVPILRDTPNPDSFPFVDETACAVTECEVEAEFSSHRWQLGLLECRVPICLRSFDENFLKFWNVYRQTQQGEPDLDTALLRFIGDKFASNLELAKWRASYFGDASSENPLYNGFDGFYAQAQANPAQVIDIAENDGATFAEQNALTGEGVYDILIQMYDEASQYPWFDPATLEFRVTRSMSAKLVTWLNRLGKNSPQNCECYDPQKLTQSNVFFMDGLTINGIPVRTHGELDTVINYSTELNGGGGAAARVNPHRAILTYRRNLLIGTSETNALNSFDIWYSKDDKKVYLEGSSYIGAAIPMEEYILAI